MSNMQRARLLTAGAVLALVLIVADFIIAEVNRIAQNDVNQRQQFINQGIQLGRVNEALVRAIAVAAVRNNDARLAAVLAEQGITVTAQGAPTAAGPVSSLGASAQGEQP